MTSLDPKQHVLGPSPWPLITLGDVAAIERKTVEPEQIREGETYVGLENITSDGKFDAVRAVRSGELKSNKFAFTREHLLYGKLRPYLAKIAAPDFSGICSTDVLPVKPGPHLDRRFLFHILRTPEMVGHASQLAVGINLPRLNPNTLEAFTVPLPPLEEQRRIAAVLDAADALRAGRRNVLSVLDSLIEAVCAKEFDTSVAIYGAERLGNHLTFVTSGARGWAEYYAETGPRFVRSLDVRMNRIADDEIVHVDAPDSAEARRIRVHPEDILLTITGSRIGRVAVAPVALDGAFISQHVAILRTDGSRLLPEFVARFLSLSTHGQRQIAARQYGQTKPGLNFEQIRAFELPVPPISEQARLLDTIGNVGTVSARAAASARGLDTLFYSLQQRALRGRL